MNQGDPGLALNGCSGGSRAANADNGAPRKHAAFIAAGAGNRKGLGTGNGGKAAGKKEGSEAVIPGLFSTSSLRKQGPIRRVVNGTGSVGGLVASSRRPIAGWGYGFLLSQGRRKRMQTHLRILAAWFVRGLRRIPYPPKRGRRECRVHDAPAASHAK